MAGRVGGSWFGAIGVMLLLSVWPACAGAVTTVSGDTDSNMPLVIDPSSDPDDPLTTTIEINATEVMFIQKMPVTKIINEVTLGDLAVAPGCSASTATAKIIEYNDGSMSGSADAQYYSTGSTAITTSPSELSWSFDPTTLRKGRGYAFSIAVSECWAFSQRTWEHNEPQVNPGPAACAMGPQGWKRMWHELGEDDAVAGCVDWPINQRGFQSSMPTGWLISEVAQDSSGNWDVVSFTDAEEGPPTCWTRNWPNSYENYGGAPVYWQPNPSFPFDPQYVCQWTQWADFGEDPEDGWYYAQPWLPQRNGAPRDMYLKLETIDYGALLDLYAPVLRFDSESEYWNASPQTMTDWEENKLRFQNPVSIPCANFSYFEHPGWGLETLVAPSHMYPGTYCPSSTIDEIDAEGDHKDAADSFRYSELDNHAYGRVVHDSEGRLWLQYWLFYYFNEQNVLGYGDHEGDWEMVQYRIKADMTPDIATYAQHEDDKAEACTWPEVEQYPIVEGGQTVRAAPVVYVAAASQASYFVQGVHERPGRPDDSADAGGEVRNTGLGLVPLMGPPTWIMWPGHWGDGGPASPSQQATRWDNPQGFHNGAGQCSYPDGTPR
jgi:hypothetical protein